MGKTATRKRLPVREHTLARYAAIRLLSQLNEDSEVIAAIAREWNIRDALARAIVQEAWDEITSADLAQAVEKVFPAAYSDTTLAKVGRNTFSSWEQTGHLRAVARTEKIRARPTCTPATVAFALLLGHLEGVRGAALFDTVWARAVDHPRSHLIELAILASQRSLIDFRHSGGVTDVGFTELLRPMEGQLL
jgi:hypothetical protein